MKFSATAPTALSADQAYAMLADLGRAATLLPAATVTGTRADGRVEGSLAGQVGTLNVSYAGHLTVAETDPPARRVAYRMRGSEQHSHDDAAGWIDVTVTEDVTAETADGCTLQVRADLEVTGRLALLGSAPLAAAITAQTQGLAQAMDAAAAGAAERLTVESPTAPAHSAETTAGEPAAAASPGALPAAARRPPFPTVVVAGSAALVVAILIRIRRHRRDG